MKNKIFLTSIFAIAFACPAMAVDGNATIENGDTCNIDNLGTSENNSTANIEAIWTLQSINCPAGTSFNASTASCDTCASGSWCVAGTYDVENNATGDGATLCSTLSNGDYPLSESGSSANTACYRNCANADVDHATQVSGAYYYGDNNQCSATQCAAGWHLADGDQLILKAGNPDLMTLIGGTGSGTTYESINNVGGRSSSYGMSIYELSTTEDHNTFVSSYGDKGKVLGRAICSTQSGNDDNRTWEHPTMFDTLTDETGQEGAVNCYCKLESYTPYGENTQSILAKWVFYDSYSSPDDQYGCAASCARACGGDMITGNPVFLPFRVAMFKSLGEYLSTCEANNIALQWYNDTVANEGTKITPNNDAANQCTYNETITVPTNEIQKPGYTFGGWKLRTNN